MAANTVLFSAILLNQMPSGKNAVVVTRSGHRFPRARFKKWRDESVDILKKLFAGSDTILEKVTLNVMYWNGDKRRRDVPGMADALLHALERAGIVADDSQIVNINWATIELDRDHPRVELKLCALH